MTIGMIAFWALIIYAIAVLLRGGQPQRPGQASPEPPEEILKRRLAEGELTIEDYERLRTALTEPPDEPTSITTTNATEAPHE